MSDTDIRAQLEQERRIIEKSDDIQVIVYTGEGLSGKPTIGVGEAHSDEAVFEDPYISPADATRIAHSWNALPVRNAQIEAVLALHRPREIVDRLSEMKLRECEADLDPWPCATVRAIEEAM